MVIRAERMPLIFTVITCWETVETLNEKFAHVYLFLNETNSQKLCKFEIFCSE